MKHARFGTVASIIIAAVLFTTLIMSVAPLAYGQQESPLGVPAQQYVTRCAGGTSYLPVSRSEYISTPFALDFMSFLVEPGGCQFDLTVSITPTDHLWQYDFYVGGLSGSTRESCAKLLPAYVWRCSVWFEGGDHPSGGYFFANGKGVFTLTIDSPTSAVHDEVVITILDRPKKTVMMLPLISSDTAATH